MPTIVKMPKWGLTMTAGTVTGWLRDEGEEVAEGDPLLTVETEKAVNDVEAPADGVLVKIVAQTGAEVPVSAPIAIIAAPGESLSEAEIAALIEAAQPAGAVGAATAGAGQRGLREARAASRDASGRVNASPAARKRAQELGIDLSTVQATGPGGRITSEDVERAAAERLADPSPREELVPLAGGRQLFTLRAGPASAPKLAFLHGLGGSLSTWQLVLGELADRYRLAAIDLPGHGQSDKRSPESTDYSVEALSSAVAECLAALHHAPAVLIGHSLGGAVAMHVALARPDLVTGLVLVNSAGLGDEISDELLSLMAGAPGRDTARRLLQLYFADERLVAERGIEELAQNQLAEGAWAAQRAVATAAFGGGKQQIAGRQRLAEVNVPVLIIWGARDRVIPLAHAVAAAEALPDAVLKIVPAVGHVPQVEAPSIVANAIARFARSIS
jgi:pyruvate dehydrogenase E2 component (dihydrolipoamide acetyltransferase)